ncbi:hypothetical protein CLU79DRAFT_512291 [Phycomyces nitens]|nr:hypothetical protein CLU79DRAFT_512291 [Phycomyces nitens]
MASILLIKPDLMHNGIVRMSGRQNIRLLQEHVRCKFGLGYYGDQFDVDLLKVLESIVSKAHYRQIMCFDTCLELWTMAKRALNLLPEKDIFTEIRKHKLCARHLVPVFQLLFDN